MSREIKFRAFEKSTERFINTWNVTGFLSVLNPFGRVEPEKYIIEQYTGLKDKNGKEIYEGDIIEAFSGTQLSFVEFKEGCFIVYLQESGDSEVCECILCNHLKDVEVIGNIHENPEILESK